MGKRTGISILSIALSILAVCLIVVSAHVRPATTSTWKSSTTVSRSEAVTAVQSAAVCAKEIRLPSFALPAPLALQSYLPLTCLFQIFFSLPVSLEHRHLRDHDEIPVRQHYYLSVLFERVISPNAP